MDSINEVVLMGRLGADPVVNENRTMLKMRLATNSRQKTANGTYEDVAQWHNVCVVGEKPVARHADKLRKGDLVWVKGSIQYKSMEKEGVKTWFTDILCFDVGWVVVGPKEKAEEGF